MRILVTGASGYIGAKLYTGLSETHNVVGTYHSTQLWNELCRVDVTDPDAVLEIVRNTQPDIIVHAAAHASRTYCENNPRDAVNTNAIGTKNIVRAASEYQTRVIYISSVGCTNPDSLYARTKLVGEDHVADCTAGYDILRASMTYGYSPNTQNDRPFNRLLDALNESGPTDIDDSWLFQPTSLDHLLAVVRHQIGRDPSNQINYVLVPEFKTRFEIALDILSEFDTELRPKRDFGSRQKTEKFRQTSSELPQFSYHEMVDKIIEQLKAAGIRHDNAD